MIRQHRAVDDEREDEVNKCMTLLKSYESHNPNDITGLLTGMANFLHAFCTSRPVHELAKQIWTLKKQLQHFPFDVNEHSKAIEALTILFVHSMESMVEREEKEYRREKRRMGQKRKKEWDFIPSHSRLPHEYTHGNEYESESAISHSQYHPSGYGETWEESAMNMDDFDLNQPNSSMREEEIGWEEGGEDMPLLEEEDGSGRYSGGLRGRGGGEKRREVKTSKDEKVEDRRYEGGLRGVRNVCISPSKSIIITNPSDHRFVPVSQRRVVTINKEKPIKVAIQRRVITASPSKIILNRVITPPRREGSTIGLGKPNIPQENNMLAKICPKSSRAQKFGVDNQGSSFISRSRARISGMISEREDEEERNMIEERKTTSLEETVVESRKKEVKNELHDGRLTNNPTEATFNTNLSETWWAMEARRSGASLLSNRMVRLNEKKKKETTESTESMEEAKN
ncbi:hypothetical protein PRIPAC_89889 [Pristionchus pacificus]|uniref:Uncharacterized protein n=1 Tax=Pristionchus pacificus TaxID=54126 RepID=A0A2A6CJ20_PRIPA|nr:hypothetical protein PRIPAC_89889 [Pristionchus pacificus]|eukprot:PDM78100.1 hypothetical protein PRIPAC_30485 [Pristionchus pacificus]